MATAESGTGRIDQGAPPGRIAHGGGAGDEGGALVAEGLQCGRAVGPLKADSCARPELTEGRSGRGGGGGAGGGGLVGGGVQCGRAVGPLKAVSCARRERPEGGGVRGDRDAVDAIPAGRLVIGAEDDRPAVGGELDGAPRD